MRIFTIAAKARICTVLLSALCTTLLLGTTIAAQSAEARSVTYNLDIPAQGLNDALQALALASQHKLLYSSDLVNGKRSPALKGPFTTEQAVKALLVGTNLKYEVTSDGLVLIRAADELPRSSAAPAATGDDPAGEDATAKEGKKSSSGDFRLAQVDQSAVGYQAVNNQNSGRKDEGLAEIIVTAQKREEHLIDVPQSVSVLSSEDLSKLGATQFRDFAATVPGLTFTTTGAGYTQVSLRGVTTGSDVGSTVGIYVDDVPYGSSSSFAQGAQLALDVGLFDIDRIEVLRGPQGTLYGASTMGGLIKYVSVSPDLTRFAGDVQAGVSGTQNGGANYNVAAATNVPIVPDTAALRVSAFESHDGGYVDNVASGRNDVNRSDVYGGRVSLLVVPTDRLTIRITGSLQNISRDGDATGDYTLAGVPVYGSLDQHRLFAEPFQQQFRLVSDNIDYDFGPVKLTSISSYQSTDTKLVHDLSGAYLPLLTEIGLPGYSALGWSEDFKTDKFTQELRLASSGLQPIEWLVGGFYTHEASGNTQQFLPRNSMDLPAPNIFYNFSSPTTFDEIAGFGDLTYHITEKLDVTGGLRYAQNHQVYTQIGSGLFIGSEPTRSSTQGVFTYLADAKYHFSDLATGYIRYATGYRPGGPNFVVTNPTNGAPEGPSTFQPDRLKSYEAGFKAETPDRTFGVDVAGYYIDWSNIQIATASGGFAVIANAPGGATVRGGELTLTARPSADFLATSVFAYQDAKLSQADADLGAASGERLPNVPRFTAAANADYTFENTGMRPMLGATARYVSDRMASFNDSVSVPQYRLPAYATVDLRAGIVVHSIDLQLYVHNLFDNRGQLSAWGAYSAPGTVEVSLVQPRTAGFLMNAKF